MSARSAWLALAIALLLLAPTLALGHGISQGDQHAMVVGGNWQYFKLGALHMLTGYDHLLFIFGVVFFLTGLRDIFKYITAFTVGHSLTLVLATLLEISANYYLVDAVIALSVCYKGFENLDGFNRYLGRPSPNLVAVIFGFGLVHGFGLSTRLQQLPLGDQGLVARIMSFNVGVEVGQVIALAAMVALIAGWRRTRSFDRFATWSNRGLIAAGALLLLMQLHGFSHSVGLSGFGFEQDNLAGASPPRSEPSDTLARAFDAYDRAFAERDVTALWELFDEDVVMFEQGKQDLGREDALGKHLGAHLAEFLEMTAEYADVRVKELNGFAVRTRRFTIKARVPDSQFEVTGYETQNWALRDGSWRLVHVHWSFADP